MSDNVASAGLMAPLSRKITQEEREEWQELLWDQNSDVKINYEGTIAYTDEGGEAYGISFGNIDTYSRSPFSELLQFNVWADMGRARSYKCYWYNGSDSDMDMLELEEFLKLTGQYE